MSAILIDGISTSGKSLLQKSIQRILIEEYPNYTKLLLTEHLTERYFENKSMDASAVTQHLIRILNILSELQKIYAESPFGANKKVLSIAAERLFLTPMSRGYLGIEFFETHRVIVERVQLKSILLLIPDDCIEDRIARSLMHRNQGWSDYIAGLGGVKQAGIHLRKQQERMKDASEVISAFIATEILEIRDVSMLSDVQFIRGLLWAVPP